MAEFTLLDDILGAWVKVEEVKAVTEMKRAETRQTNERQTTGYQDGIKAGQAGGAAQSNAAGVQISQNMLVGGFLGLVGLGLVVVMLR